MQLSEYSIELCQNLNDGSFILLKHKTSDKKDYLFQGKKPSDHEAWVQLLTENIAKCSNSNSSPDHNTSANISPTQKSPKISKRSSHILSELPSRRFGHKKKKEKPLHFSLGTTELPEGRIFGTHLREQEVHPDDHVPKFVHDCTTYLSNFCNYPFILKLLG